VKLLLAQGVTISRKDIELAKEKGEWHIVNELNTHKLGLHLLG